MYPNEHYDLHFPSTKPWSYLMGISSDGSVLFYKRQKKGRPPRYPIHPLMMRRLSYNLSNTYLSPHIAMVLRWSNSSLGITPYERVRVHIP